AERRVRDRAVPERHRRYPRQGPARGRRRPAHRRARADLTAGSLFRTAAAVTAPRPLAAFAHPSLPLARALTCVHVISRLIFGQQLRISDIDEAAPPAP